MLRHVWLCHVSLIAAILASGLFLGAFATTAQTQGVLPSSFAGWNANGKSGFSPEQNSSGDGRVAAEVAKEYDFVSGEHSSYTRGSDTLDVTAYEMKDPSGAYGEYSYLRTD